MKDIIAYRLVRYAPEILELSQLDVAAETKRRLSLNSSKFKM